MRRSYRAVRTSACGVLVRGRPLTASARTEWNATLLQPDVANEVQKLKQTDQNLLIYGSGTLVHTLMSHSLIDVCRIMLYPLTLSSGQRFFREGGDRTTFTLTDAKTTSTGVVILTYEPAGGTADEPSAGGEQ